MVGERSYVVSFNYAPLLEASYSSGQWISTLVVGSDSDWELRVKFGLAHILTRRTTNHSPQPKMSPVVNAMFGCNTTLVIPVVDPDGDPVRCRWAEAVPGECAGVCLAFPGSSLDQSHCTMSYLNVSRVGWYAVALQIEDFFDASDRVPLSSVPIQFLVNVYDGGNR